jgi:hypothetical protein
MWPIIYVQPVSIAVSVIAAFFLGGMWYGPLFGQLWVRLIGMDLSKPPKSEEISRGMALSILGSTFCSFVLCHLVQIVRPSAWGHMGQDRSPEAYGFGVGFFVWLGFYVPVCLNSVAWERRSWGLCFLNMAYWFCHCQLIALIHSMTV